MATVVYRWASGPDSPIFSIAAIPASVYGASSPADAWKTSTFTWFFAPGGDGRDNVVAIFSTRARSGDWSALAGPPPPSMDTVSAPAATAAARPRRDLDR
ncbi:hypothetical protein GCM10010284_42260 [Streptomyces rubiginosohelvolus]|uniref:Uncharacterized protein n=1 Tax=Streptomyces rubiginosohelvolus TaxID=67362 RepID=A0ABQ3BS87_9ACTN|nr:hypothetical protein GCM10010284_42260 [Streptomyces rubiginosohelvolus]GGZ55146.1 hypothetical protein GCM10010328_32390 [Streptomyces pluricolorescens]